MPDLPKTKQPHGRAAALAVATGILLSKLIGLIRERIFAHYFGNSMAADAFKAAFRIPNMLQNLFGEGVLSASFIPVYARLNAEERHEEATRTAAAIFAILVLVASVLVLLGVLFAPALVDIIAYGFRGETRLLTIQLVRILFPGAALLVLSAWCLGILNSHRRFLLSYTAPVVWNVAMIATLVWQGRSLFAHGITAASVAEPRLAVALAIGSVIGSALQFFVQIPSVLRLLSPLQWKATFRSEHVRTIVHNFFPVFISRGVVQFSAFVDQMLASPAAHRRGRRAQLRADHQPASRLALRHGRLRRGAARHVRGPRHTGADRRQAPRPPRRRPAADRLVRRPLRRRLRRARRCGGRRHLSHRPLRRARRHLRLERARRLRRRPARRHLRPPLLIGLLRAAQHPHAAQLRGHPRRAHARARLLLSPSPCPTCSASTRAGASPASPSPPASPHGSSTHSSAAPCTSASASSTTPPAASSASGSPPSWPRVLCFLLHQHLPIHGHGSRAAILTAIAVLIPYGALYVAFTVLMKVPIPGSLLRRFKRS